MVEKTYIPEGAIAPPSQIGATIEALAATIEARRDAGEGSYTYRLLSGSADEVLKKVAEEAVEVALAAKDVDACALAAAQPGASPASIGSGVSASHDVEVAAACDNAVNHLRYEAADVVYHLLVVLERYGIGLDEFAAELNYRMTEDERPEGGALLHDEYVKRGK